MMSMIIDNDNDNDNDLSLYFSVSRSTYLLSGNMFGHLYFITGAG